MKRIQEFTVLSNEPLNSTVYKMVIGCEDTSWITNSGQFVNVSVESGYLRRPISISDWDDTTFTLAYKVVGKGTKYLTSLVKGDLINCLIGLGNGFDPEVIENEEVLVVGGGIGVAPMLGCAKACLAAGKKVVTVLGFASESDCIYLDEFTKLGCKVFVSTNDGSVGTKGFVSDVMNNEGLNDLPYLACGPMPMLKAVYKTSKAVGQLSFEERMGCGFGACMGCSYQTKNGVKRICKEGPVLSSEELLWND